MVRQGFVAVLVKGAAGMVVVASAMPALSIDLTTSTVLLYDQFPRGGQGAGGVRCQSRDLVTGQYLDLVQNGQTFFGTPAAPFQVPSVFLVGPRVVLCHPSEINQCGSRRDAVYRVRLDGCGLASVLIESTTGRNPAFNPTVTWYVYVGEGNWANPVFFSNQLNQPISVTIPFESGMEVFFATNAGANDPNDNAGFVEPRVTGLAHASCRPDLTASAVAGSPCYGHPNGTLDSDDFFYYLTHFAEGNLAIADLTTTAVAGTPGYGVPNGVLNHDDFFYYLALFAAGC